jgi:hypothetical protein
MLLAQAMRTHGASRATIARGIERMTFVGPDGVHRFSRRKHAGLSARSLLVVRVRNCELAPVPGRDLGG